MNVRLTRKLAVLLFAALFSCASCAGNQEAASPKALRTENAAPPTTKPVNETIRFLEERVKLDSEDYIALNKLATEYLQQMRKTGDAGYLPLAERAARASLDVLPAIQNKEALALLALVKYSSHEFAESRDYAKQLVELESNKGYAYQILGDALLELGEYKEAEAAYREMESLGGIQLLTKSAMRQRLARLAAIKGNWKETERHYSEALKLAEAMPSPSAETVAYCRWQLGETAFARGDYETAEKHYNVALETLPDYANALASMGKTRAARGDLTAAIEFYERAAERLPEIVFIAALGDLYKIAGREADAARQYDLVEQIGNLSRDKGSLYDRSLAMFYADNNLKPEEAYRMAAKEYETRRDIYGADALAWTALKSGKIGEAQEKIKEALRFGTEDARLFYHAGMIAHAAGERGEARKYLRRALALNPKFNLTQAEICRKTLESL